MGIHHQFRQFAFAWQFIHHRQAITLIAHNQLALMLAKHTHIDKPIIVQMQGETVVAIIAHKFIAIIIHLLMWDFHITAHLVATLVIKRESEIRNL